MRVRCTVALLLGAASLSVAACGDSNDSSASGGSSSSSAAKGAPLKVSLISPSSGALAVFGKDAVNGWRLAADQANAAGGVDGHKVELVVSETDGTPPVTLRAARKAAAGGAHFVSSVFTSPENAALAQAAPSIDDVVINAIGQDDAFTGADCSAAAFRTVQSNSMNINTLAASLAKIPGTKWAIQSTDYSTGHTAAENFTAAAKKAGKQVVLTQYAPLNTSDFGSFISKLKSSGADALFAYETGADAVAFINQGTQFKLFDQFKSVLGLNMVSEPLFKALGDKIVGFYNNVGYDKGQDNALNQAFVKSYGAKYGVPYYVPADNFMAAEALFAAVKKAGSVDPKKVEAAMNDLQFDSINGPATIRAADHQILRPTWVGQVEKSGSGLGWKIVNEVPAAQTTPQANPACQLGG